MWGEGASKVGITLYNNIYGIILMKKKPFSELRRRKCFQGVLYNCDLAGLFNFLILRKLNFDRPCYFWSVNWHKHVDV